MIQGCVELCSVYVDLNFGVTSIGPQCSYNHCQITALHLQQMSSVTVEALGCSASNLTVFSGESPITNPFLRQIVFRWRMPEVQLVSWRAFWEFTFLCCKHVTTVELTGDGNSDEVFVTYVPSSWAQYCDERVSVCVCISRELFVQSYTKFFCARYLWPWLGPPLVAMQYVTSSFMDDVVFSHNGPYNSMLVLLQWCHCTVLVASCLKRRLVLRLEVRWVHPASSSRGGVCVATLPCLWNQLQFLVLSLAPVSLHLLLLSSCLSPSIHHSCHL